MIKDDKKKKEGKSVMLRGLNEEDKKIIETLKFAYDKKTQEEAIIEGIRKCSIFDPKVAEILRAKKRW